MSQYHALLGNTSSIGANIIYTPDESNIKPGEDFVVYDKFEDKYKALRAHSYEEMSFDTERYETNWDVIIGHKDGITHAVAKDDAYNQTDTVQDDTAAAPCYYRIEIDNTQDGGFHYNLYSHDRQEGDVSWSANDTMQSILNKIAVPSYSGKAVLNDGTGIGIYLGGYSSNTCQITNITGTVTVVDMSQFATEDDYSETEYKGSEQYSIRPTADGVLANKPRFDGTGNAEIKSLYGNSIVWNQQTNLGKYAYNDCDYTQIIRKTYDFSGGIIAGHKYLATAKVKTSEYINSTYFRISDAVNMSYNIYPQFEKDKETILYLDFTALHSSNRRYFQFQVDENGASKNYDFEISEFQFFDLTQMFGEGNEPTVEQFKQCFPNDYYEYNEGEIINVNIDGLKTVGFNMWDEEWEVGSINTADGVNNNTATQYIRSKNYIKVVGGVSYYHSSNSQMRLFFYDINKTYITFINWSWSGIFTTPSNAAFMRFVPYLTYGPTYNNDICINLSLSGYRNGDYEPYQEHNINIPVKEIRDKDNNLLFPDGLMSAGTAKDEITSDKAVKRIGVVEFDGTEGSYDSDASRFVATIPGVKRTESSTQKINALCNFYEQGTIFDILQTQSDNVFAFNNTNDVISIRDTAYTSLDAWRQNLANLKAAGIPLTVYYELETPIEVNFKDVPQSFGEKLDLTYTYDPYGTEEFLYDSEDIKVPASTINRYESHMYASAPYTEKNQKINDSFKNWRGVSAQTILGSSKIPVGPNSSCLCNNNQNYSYRSGANFSGWKSWASTNGVTTFTTDGVNGTVNNSAGVVMSQSTFNSNVNNTFAESSENYKMYDYYNRLLNSEGNEFAYLHNQYVERYGTMSTLYDAYLMSHMVNTDNPSSGITYTAMNMGKQLTDVKGRVMAVDYNYNYVPAYPPEYNALHYGVSKKDSMFSKGRYNHPEVYDLGLMFRDDIMQKCNTNWSKIKGIKYTALANNMYRGSCAEYASNLTWIFGGTSRCVGDGNRYNGHFRSRPVLCFNN